MNIPAIYIPHKIDIVKKKFTYKRNLHLFKRPKNNEPNNNFKDKVKKKIKLLFNNLKEFILKNYGYCIALVIFILFFKQEIKSLIYTKSEVPSWMNYFQFIFALSLIRLITQTLKKNKSYLNIIVLVFFVLCTFCIIAHILIIILSIIIPYLILYTSLFFIYMYIYNQIKK